MAESNPLAFALAAGLFTALAAVEEGALRAPTLHLLPGSTPSLAATRAVAALGGGAALWLGFRLARDERWLGWSLAALSVALAANGPAWFIGFRSSNAALLAFAAPLAVCSAVGLVLGAGARTLGAAARSLEVVGYVVHPFRALLGLALLVLGVALGARLGAWRSAALLSVWVAGLGLFSGHLRQFLYGRASTRGELGAPFIGIVLGLGSLGGAEWALPRSELGRYPGEVVYASAGPAHYAVSSVQRSFEVYRGNVLRIASVDAKRYAECLVHPALGLAKRRERVLLLGASDGIVEREILRYGDVRELTTLTDDPALAELALGNAFFAELGASSLRSPRVRRVTAEPLPWLAASHAEFDAIIVDLPDPSDFSQGKNYTRYFYRALRERLAPGGLFVSQATSSASSPGTFSSIARTIASAGFRVRSYAAPIPTLGEWGFVIGSLEPLPEPSLLSDAVQRVLAHSSYVDGARLGLLLAAPPPIDEQAEISTLEQQPLIERLTIERHARGL